MAALALAVTLSACGSGGGLHQSVSGHPTSSSADYDETPADFRAVRKLMAVRAQAVLHHDRAAFLATIDPGRANLRAEQEILFENLTALPVARLTYAVADDAYPPDPVPGDDPTFRPELYEHLQLERTFRRPMTNPDNVTFVRRDGRWLVGAETQASTADGLGAPVERPWFGDPIAVATDGSITALVDADNPASADFARTLAHQVSTDISSDAALLGVPATRAVLVDATSNGLTHAMNGISNEEAGAVTFAVEATDALGRTSRGLAGEVVKANPHFLQQLLDDGVTLRHELTHLLLRQYSGVVPTWVSEGIAEYVGYYPHRSTELADSGAFGAVLAEPPEIPISGLYDLDPAASYGIAEAAVHQLVATYGMPRFIDLLERYRKKYTDPYGDVITDAMLEGEYGISLKTLTEQTWANLRALHQAQQ